MAEGRPLAQAIATILIAMPLPNRVDPFGALFSTVEHGTLMGNRGGRFHDPESRTLGKRSHATRQWICCRLDFKGRQRKVWGKGYTELFFSDEVAALAAGHRPCFECRRHDATAFASAWGRACATPPPSAPEMDHVLHLQRRTFGPASVKKTYDTMAVHLPDGTMVAINGMPHALHGAFAFRWHFTGYGPAFPRPDGKVCVLTPPAIVACLTHGYKPVSGPKVDGMSEIAFR